MPEKYQEEIEEILRGLGDKTPAGTGAEKPLDDAPVAAHPTAPSYEPPSAKPGLWQMLWQPGKLALIGLALLVSGLLFKPLIWVGLSILVVAYLLFFVRPRPIRIDKRWRGQPVESRATAWDKFKRWMKS